MDSGSPIVSVAVGQKNVTLAERSEGGAHSSASLLPMIDKALNTAGCRATDLEAVIGLRGPGSFTGLRVGLATLLGLRQALDIPAAAAPTLEVLAYLAPEETGPVVAAVDALRDRWLVQSFEPGRPPKAQNSPSCLSTADLASVNGRCLIGFGVQRLRQTPGWCDEIKLVEPPPLATVVIQASRFLPLTWDGSGLLDPLYLQSLDYQPQVKRPS